MEKSIKYDDMCDYAHVNCDETEHPLISVVNFTSAKIPVRSTAQSGLYGIVISPLDNREGILSFISPEQLIDTQLKSVSHQLAGQALLFHPEQIAGTSLANFINDYSFYNHINKPLRLSREEHKAVLGYFSNIVDELKYFQDKHSKKLIAANIELCLSYCERFYSTRFISTNYNNGISHRLDKSLSLYFSSDNPLLFGIPSVAYCAGELNLSANYFGNLIKKETGKTAQEYIRNKMIEEAKYRIINVNKTINEIANELGFKYPQHLSRIFKKVVGQSPVEYRKVNVNYYENNFNHSNHCNIPFCFVH